MIDPLFFSQECSDARICLRTGPVCMCGIEKMQERVKKLEAVAEAARTWTDMMPASDLAKALAALDAPAAHDGDGDAD